MRTETREKARGLAVVVPMSVYYFIFTLVPVFMLFFYAFTNYNVIKNQMDFVKWNNFKSFFKYPEYLQSVWSTLLIAVFVVAVGMVLGFILALMLTKIRPGRSFFRMIWYIPALLPMAVVSRFISVLLSPQGSMNALLSAFGMDAVDWGSSAFWMYFWIIFVVSWKGLGSTAILFIAGLNGVDKDVYEAADIDGANGWQKVAKITLPLIRPMLGFILITGFIGAFNIFEPVLFISNGNPNGATKVILFRIYDEAFVNGNLGFASAISVIVFFIVLLLTYVNMKITDDSMLKM